jgi:hypothetical protein
MSAPTSYRARPANWATLSTKERIESIARDAGIDPDTIWDWSLVKFALEVSNRRATQIEDDNRRLTGQS